MVVVLRLLLLITLSPAVDEVAAIERRFMTSRVDAAEVDEEAPTEGEEQPEGAPLFEIKDSLFDSGDVKLSAFE